MRPVTLVELVHGYRIELTTGRRLRIKRTGSIRTRYGQNVRGLEIQGVGCAGSPAWTTVHSPAGNLSDAANAADSRPCLDKCDHS